MLYEVITELDGWVSTGGTELMITKWKENPVVRPSDVTPSLDGYRVLGAFNPGATVFNDEILLLLRVAEGCEPREGYIRAPVYEFKEGRSGPSYNFV